MPENPEEASIDSRGTALRPPALPLLRVRGQGQAHARPPRGQDALRRREALPLLQVQLRHQSQTLFKATAYTIVTVSYFVLLLITIY